REAGGTEAALRVRPLRIQLDPVVARTELHLQRACALLLQHEHAGAAGNRAGHEGLGTYRAEIDPGRLQAERTAPAGQLLLHRLQARVVAAAGEAGADLVAFQLHVLVIAPGAMEIYPLQERRRVV